MTDAEFWHSYVPRRLAEHRIWQEREANRRYWELIAEAELHLLEEVEEGEVNDIQR